MSLFATKGAGMMGAKLDGAPIPMESQVERGHPVLSTFLEIDPGASRTVVFDLIEPAGKGSALMPVQPLVRPQRSTAHVAGCDKK